MNLTTSELDTIYFYFIKLGHFIPTGPRFSPEMLVELMGDSMSLPHRNPPGGARYSKKEERVLLDLPADSRP